jgi:hypothetical protein
VQSSKTTQSLTALSARRAALATRVTSRNRSSELMSACARAQNPPRQIPGLNASA